MDDTITTIYCLCDELLKAWGHRNDPQARLSTAEVMTVPLVAAAFFGGNVERSRRFLREYGYVPAMISKSRFNRRLHAIEPELWRGLFSMLAGVFKRRNTQGTYAVDSLPVAACDNIRIRRCRLYPPEEHGGAFRGYIASKRRYFYGLRVHLVVTEAGEPVEFALAAGSEADVSVFKDLELDLFARRLDHLCRQGLHRLRLRGPSEGSRPAPKSPAQEELQTAAASVGGVLGQASTPIHRNGLRRAERVVLQEDPCGHATRL